jgi:DNA-binding PadR family transcriptional regulator
MYTGYVRSDALKYALLALLAAGHDHGYALKRAFEERFGSVWPPVNIGQIYSTLARLERDALVECREVEQQGRPAKKVYRLTQLGRGELESWTREQASGPRLRDDFFMKLVLGPLSGAATASELIEEQRLAYYQSLRDIDRELTDTEPGSTAALLLEGAALQVQADLKWLDMCDNWLGGEQ